MKYALLAIKSGNDGAGLWVGLRYRSKDGEQHDFYIVGGEEMSARPSGRTLVPIYYERDDQSLSSYAGAERIVVTGSAVVLTLNKNGRASLELTGTVELAAMKPGRDFKRARAIFVEMSKRHSGEVIHVA